MERVCAVDRLGVGGQPGAGYLFARTSMLLTRRITDAPSSIIVQFAGTFTVWIVAEHIGLSGILTIVAYAITIARTAPGTHAGAAARAVLRGVGHRVFVLNVLAFMRSGCSCGRSGNGSTICAAGILRGGSLRPRHRDRHRIAWVITYGTTHAVLDRARYRSSQTPDGRAHRRRRHCGVLVRDARHRHAGGGVRAAGRFSISRSHAVDGVCRVLGSLVIQGLTLRP